jgi:hypothetical protein
LVGAEEFNPRGLKRIAQLMAKQRQLDRFTAQACPGVAYYGDDDAFGVAIETREGKTISIRLHRQQAEKLTKDIVSALESYQPKTPKQVQEHNLVLAPGKY